MGGGDLLNLLIERDVFEEDFTRFYVAEVRHRSPAFQIAVGYVLTTSTSIVMGCTMEKRWS